MASNNRTRWFELPDNYLYISHLGNNGQWIRLPSYPDSISDNMQSSFSETDALARTAPVYTYQKSGPRSMQIQLKIHRDLMDDVNSDGASNMTTEDYDDYTDTLIKKLQSLALPKYNLNNKFVEPPLVALRITNEIFIKGIVSGTVGVSYEGPILSNGKYSVVNVSFTIYETDPYDATTVNKNGGFRGITACMNAQIESLRDHETGFYDLGNGTFFDYETNNNSRWGLR